MRIKVGKVGAPPGSVAFLW